MALIGIKFGTTVFGRGVVDESGSPAADLPDRLRSGQGLERLGAPYAAALVEPEEATVAADHIGLRHVYGAQQPGWAAVGTSARDLASRMKAPVDVGALSVFRLAGHYLDSDTAYAGVTKLPAAHFWRLRDGRLTSEGYPLVDVAPADPARAHAARLRQLVNGFLDHHADVRIELSGGLDSRVVLASVEPRRRRSVTAFTIVNGRSTDATVAARLAQHFGMKCEFVDVNDMAGLEPAQAHEMAADAARRMDGLGRPLSAAVFNWVESQVSQAPRLSGHGGEMARALFGPGVEFERPYTTVSVDVARNYIRRWMLSNDAVPDHVLSPEFAAESRELAMNRLVDALQRTGSDWLGSLSDFYLRQRMHRFAGITITDGCTSRLSLNPLTDAEVLAIAMSVPTRERVGSRYAVRVLELLDPELARIPLGSGLRPVALNRTITMSRRLGENTWRGFVAKASGKVVRSVISRRRAAVGAPLLADLVVRHWRAEPSLLEPALRSGLVNQEWAGKMLDGSAGADATTVDFLLNLSLIVT